MRALHDPELLACAVPPEAYAEHRNFVMVHTDRLEVAHNTCAQIQFVKIRSIAARVRTSDAVVL